MNNESTTLWAWLHSAAKMCLEPVFNEFGYKHLDDIGFPRDEDWKHGGGVSYVPDEGPPPIAFLDIQVMFDQKKGYRVRCYIGNKNVISFCPQHTTAAYFTREVDGWRCLTEEDVIQTLEQVAACINDFFKSQQSN